jgi:hypothetical protein
VLHPTLYYTARSGPTCHAEPSSNVAHGEFCYPEPRRVQDKPFGTARSPASLTKTAPSEASARDCEMPTCGSSPAGLTFASQSPALDVLAEAANESNQRRRRVVGRNACLSCSAVLCESPIASCPSHCSLDSVPRPVSSWPASN